MTTAQEEIQQNKGFQSEWHKLRVNLLITNGWLKNLIKDFLDEYDITQQQFNILRILRGAKGEPLSTNDLSDRMIDKMSDASRIVDRLISKNLVRKNPCPHDGRKIQVFITDEGESLLSTIDAEMDTFNAKFDALSLEEARTLNQLLEKLRG